MPVARGDLTLKDQGRIHAAVTAAEAATGIAFCVAVTEAGDSSPGLVADAAFLDLNLGDDAAVMVLVVPEARGVEIRTSSAAQLVLTDAICARAVAEMRIPFVRDAIAEGIEAGMAVFTAAVSAAPAPSA